MTSDSDPCTGKYDAFFLSSVTRLLPWHVPGDAGFLSDKGSVLGAGIKKTRVFVIPACRN